MPSRLVKQMVIKSHFATKKSPNIVPFNQGAGEDASPTKFAFATDVGFGNNITTLQT